MVLQLTLQGAEIEVPALLQLIRLEQVGYDHDINGVLVVRQLVLRTQRARDTSRSANYGSR